MSETTPASPDRRCDLVMKGGVASGIVYPLAITELARTYRFVNIGGTSAGAMAAAATAAAERGRQTGGSWEETFGRLAGLPAVLAATNGGRQSKLRSLFQPQPSLADVFAPLAAVIDAMPAGRRRTAKPDPRRLGGAFVGSAMSRYPAWAAAGALPGALLLADAVLGNRGAGIRAGAGTAVELLVGASAALAGAPLAALAGWGREARERIPENLLGMCTGHAEEPGASPEHLTDWLGALLDDLAQAQRPLTFGDLDESGVQLRMVTTNLSLGRPMELPFGAPGDLPDDRDEDAGPQWWFDPGEFRRLFPGRVVEAMESEPRAERCCGLVSLPPWERLPVLVATRMSLSFPFLLSAVPLHPTAPGTRGPAREPMWFSDGGICSNFPIHFFDSPLPRRPTFGINLRPASPQESELVWWPEEDPDRDRANDAATPWFTFWRAGEEKLSLLGFLGALKDTAQNWHDSVQLEMPGFRDRVVHVGLKPEEGGLNLAMGAETVEEVAQRGSEAARRLTKAYAAGEYWDEHRWTRYRLFFAAAEELLAHVNRGYHDPDEHGGADGDGGRRLTYEELARRAPGTAPVTDFDWTEPRVELLTRRVEALTELARAWGVRPELAEGRPVPPPKLKLGPRL